MPTETTRELHGLKCLVAMRHQHRPTDNKPLTEEQKEDHRLSIHNAKLKRELNKLQSELCCLLDDKIFLAASLQFVASKLTGIKLQTASSKLERVETRPGITPSEQMDIVIIRLRDARLGYQTDIETLRMLNRCLIAQADSKSKEYPEPDTPELLYRAFTSQSHSRHSEELGFRSSNQPLSLPVHHDGTLLNSLLVDQDSLTNHCKGPQPSDLIALSDSPSRIFKILTTWSYGDRDGDIIAVINVSKLLATGCLFNRTTTLAKELGLEIWNGSRPNGLQYANPNYWVAYRWIPAECIECYVSETVLRKACVTRGIGESDWSARLSLDEIVASKLENLSL